MSVLSDSKILEEIDNDRILIKPYNRSQLGSNSYDCILDDKLLVYEDDILDCKKDHKTSEITIPDEGMLILPGRLYLGSTVEYTETKDHVVMFEGKSSLARLGLFVHITAGFGDDCYQGHFTVELACVQPIRIYKGMKIGQLYYQTIEGMVINPYNIKLDAKYNFNGRGPIKSKMFMNFETNKSKIQQRFIDSGIPNYPDDDNV